MAVKAGMAGSSLAWDDLLAWLCAGSEAREKIQQHRVSTEGGREGGTMQQVEWCSFKSWLSREWPGRLPRGVVAKSGCCRRWVRVRKQATETETV